jgi:hypothetical protein
VSPPGELANTAPIAASRADLMGELPALECVRLERPQRMRVACTVRVSPAAVMRIQ